MCVPSANEDQPASRWHLSHSVHAASQKATEALEMGRMKLAPAEEPSHRTSARETEEENDT
jgi:hypothetical protein